MPPAFRTPPQQRYEMRPLYYLTAIVVTCLAIPMLALALLFGSVAIFEAIDISSYTPKFLERLFGYFSFALGMVGFSFLLSWASAILGTIALVFALKWGGGGWGTAMIFGVISGALTALIMTEGQMNKGDVVAVVSISATGAFLGLAYWITCYRLAPAAFKPS